MEPNNAAYQPGTDQNQGVVGTMARAEQTNTLDPAEVGAAQEPRTSPNAVTRAESDMLDMAGEATNADMLDEEAVANGDVDVNGDDSYYEADTDEDGETSL